MVSLNMSSVVEEFMEANPLLFSCVISAMLNSNNFLSNIRIQHILPRIAMVYSIIEQTNFPELSLMQSSVSMMLEDAVCEQKVWI